jgi:Domain of unknown function (DUF5122) beta-propeller
MVVQPDGKLVVGADFTGGSDALARYNADGSNGRWRPSLSD